MKCMKCGRDTPDTQAFCDSCTAGMNRYPVAIDTVVQLPSAKSRQPSKKPVHHRAPSDREQLQRMKRRHHRLRIALAAVFVLWIVSAGINFWLAEKIHQPLRGQNYSTTASKSDSGEK